MKVLTRKKDELEGYIMVCLEDAVLRQHIHLLVHRGLYGRAISEARTSGKGLKALSEGEAYSEEVSLILTEKSAHWDAAI
jgi:hypothetical protein